MITETTTRYESDGRLCGHMCTKTHSVEVTAWDMVKFELGYGGRPIRATEYELLIRTPIFGRYDMITYKGPPEELRILIAIAAAVLELDAAVSPEDKAAMWLKEIPEPWRGRPFALAQFSPMFFGAKVSHVAVLGLIASGKGVTEEEEMKALFEKLRPLSKETQVRMAVAILQGVDMSIEDMIQVYS